MAVTRNTTTPNVGPTVLYQHGFFHVSYYTHKKISITIFFSLENINTFIVHVLLDCYLKA
uniref:Uncharacterized protein n=1 Tax=Physcomitrium patens TaxID=3218 RepID=A0A2K1JJC9_PHYPA|nr:hypothetical protein PHYPA_019057 [Physcomitrium patens]